MNPWGLINSPQSDEVEREESLIDTPAAFFSRTPMKRRAYFARWIAVNESLSTEKTPPQISPIGVHDEPCSWMNVLDRTVVPRAPGYRMICTLLLYKVQ